MLEGSPRTIVFKKWVIKFKVNVKIINSFTIEFLRLREGIRLVQGKGLNKVVVKLDSKAMVKVVQKEI